MLAILKIGHTRTIVYSTLFLIPLPAQTSMSTCISNVDLATTSKYVYMQLAHVTYSTFCIKTQVPDTQMFDIDGTILYSTAQKF